MSAARTSKSHPLQIATLRIGPGAVGLTLCPGKKGDSFFGAAWDRDLEADVATICAWGAKAVVTLIEDHEFRLLEVERLPDVVRAVGLDWHWLPIRDVSIPDRRFEERWVEVWPMLRASIRMGRRVLVHCRGGLGRAGMVAARMLVELGTGPADAILAVRAARPGAIETPEQERWVLGLREGPET